MASTRTVFFALVALNLFHHAATQMNIDGGRSDLPGMKQDMFDRVNSQKGKPGPQARGKGRPDCPKSDKMSPFFGLAFVSGEVYVKLNSTEQQCQRLITVGGANYSELTNASKTCGPAGEWKKRIAEEMSAVFFQGGQEWVKNENETIEVVTEEGTFDVVVSEEKFNELVECWTRGCGCEQAKNPAGRAMCMTLLAIAVTAIGWDSVKLSLEKMRGKKPPSKVQCKKGHKMEEVKFAYTHSCDVCGKSGTQYQCSVSCNYDMCKPCYKAAKKKLKAEYEAWIKIHPEDAKPEKKGKKDDDDDDEDTKKSDSEAAKSEAESEGVSTKKSEDEDKSRDGSSAAGENADAED